MPKFYLLLAFTMVVFTSPLVSSAPSCRGVFSQGLLSPLRPLPLLEQKIEKNRQVANEKQLYIDHLIDTLNRHINSRKAGGPGVESEIQALLNQWTQVKESQTQNLPTPLLSSVTAHGPPTTVDQFLNLIKSTDFRIENETQLESISNLMAPLALDYQNYTSILQTLIAKANPDLVDTNPIAKDLGPQWAPRAHRSFRSSSHPR